MKRFYSLLIALLVVAGSTFAQEDCATAVAIASSPTTWSVAGSTTGALDDYNEVCPYAVLGGLDQVYVWNPAVSGFYDLSLCLGSTNYDTKLYIYEGACPAVGTGTTGTELGCNDDACDNGVTFPNPWISSITNVVMNAGTNYYVVVDGYDAAGGAYTLLVQPSVAPPVGDDLLMGEGRLYDYGQLPSYNVTASTFASVVLNQGSSTVDATVTLNVFSDADLFVTSIFTDVSAPTSVAPATVELVSGTSPFTPPANGVYIMEYVVTSSGVDDTATNDTSFAFLNVTDTFQSRDLSWAGALLSATRLLYSSALAEYGVIQDYAVDVDLVGATLLISTDATFISEPITCNVYSIGVDIDDNTLVASGSVPTDTGTIVFDIPLSGSLAAGSYVQAYQGNHFPIQTDFIYTQVASDLVREPVTTGGLWGFFAGPYAWSHELQATEASVECDPSTAPVGLTSTNGASSVALAWNAIPQSVACQVKGTRITPPGPSPSVNLIGFEVTGTTVPYSAAGTGTTWDWQVRCACSIPPNPIIATPFSTFGSFTVPAPREAAAVELAIFPNPAADQLMVGFTAVGGETSFNIVDVMGKVVTATSETLTEGMTNMSFDVSELAEGVYFLTIEEGNNRQVEEFTVVH